GKLGSPRQRLLGASSRLGRVRRAGGYPPFLSHPAGTVRFMGDADKLLSDLNDRQREAVTTPVAPLAILAGAGSGKTRVLTRRIAWQAAEGIVDPRHVLAVTFTRKAAGELSGRLDTLGVRRIVTSGTFH